MVRVASRVRCSRSLNARKGELTKTKAELEKALEELRADLATQTANRAEEKAENEQTVPRQDPCRLARVAVFMHRFLQCSCSCTPCIAVEVYL